MFKQNQKIIYSLIACIASVSSASNAEPLYNYVALNTGIASPVSTNGNSELSGSNGKSAFIANLAVGRKFYTRFGAELQYLYRSNSGISANTQIMPAGQPIVNSSNSWGVSSNSLLLNFTADILTEGAIIPYLKAGFGFSRNKSKQYSFNYSYGSQTYPGKNKNSFAWQVGFGANVAASKSFDVNAEYAYVDRGKFETASSNTTIAGAMFTFPAAARTGYLRDHTVTLGIKYKF